MRTVIVGGGVAGMTAALDLARRDVGEVLVFCDEVHPYYYRPQLTEVLAGSLTPEKLVRRPLSYYAARNIHVSLGTPVTGLDTDRKVIATQDGREVGYDRLLLATGSMPFVPPAEGSDKIGVRTWRTLDDTLALAQTAAGCQEIIVIGGGLLGLEAARGLRSLCPQVTVVEYFPRLMPRQLDVEGAQLLQSFVESLGIRVLVGAQVRDILGDERVSGVALKDGRCLPAQVVLVAAGVRCNSSLAAAAGITVDRGILVDDYLQTSAPDTYAAGDAALYRGHSWAIAPIAQAQARVAAANIAGDRVAYDIVVPSTTLKIVGIDVASIGITLPEDSDCEEIRGMDAEHGVYRKIVLRDGVIVGTIAINDKNLAKDLESRIAQQARLTRSEAEALVSK